MPNIVSLVLLGAEYFCIPISLFDLSFVMQFGYL